MMVKVAGSVGWARGLGTMVGWVEHIDQYDARAARACESSLEKTKCV